MKKKNTPTLMFLTVSIALQFTMGLGQIFSNHRYAMGAGWVIAGSLSGLACCCYMKERKRE